MAQRPTLDDFITWRGIPSTALEGDGSLVTEAFDAARDAVEDESRLTEEALAANSAVYPSQVRFVVFLQANRLVKRQSTPEGVAAFGDLGPIRIAGVDPDYRELLGKYLKVDGFA